ncbi:MAG: heme-binding beta-barrel domain-containing protein [Candidatus Binatia bacterium]|nr:heme-binding beta-barrel domain-containing protein [Candidatus Binatia bacterium]
MATTFGPPAHMAAFTDVDERWGPLAKLAGQWAGDKGRDFSFSYGENKDTENLYREEITFDPFGPVDNGKQSMFALDYRMKAWRIGADDFFHMEVGYWLWEPSTGTLHRCFMVPRSTTIVAEGKAAADATSFKLSAKQGSPTNGILSNSYLYDGAAKCTGYNLEVDLSGGNYSYKEDTILAMASHGGAEMHHTDENSLQKI